MFVSCRDPMLNFYTDTKNLAHLVGELVALSLGIDTTVLHKHFSRQTIGMNYYPTCPQPDLAFGLSSHSDFGSITLLMQDAEGLQVKKGDEWVNVKVVPNSFIVLIGDQLEVHLSPLEYVLFMHTHLPILDRYSINLKLVPIYCACVLL